MFCSMMMAATVAATPLPAAPAPSPTYAPPMDMSWAISPGMCPPATYVSPQLQAQADARLKAAYAAYYELMKRRRPVTPAPAPSPAATPAPPPMDMSWAIRQQMEARDSLIWCPNDTPATPTVSHAGEKGWVLARCITGDCFKHDDLTECIKRDGRKVWYKPYVACGPKEDSDDAPAKVARKSPACCGGGSPYDYLRRARENGGRYW